MSLPSGDGTVGATEPGAALDEDATPDTGLEPDTAGDAAGTTSSSAAADAGPDSDPDTRAAEMPGETAGDTTDSAGSGGPDRSSTVTETRAEPPSAVTELDGPALENDEMRTGTADLQSSERKTAEARGIVDDLTAKTQPSAPDTVMPG